MFAKDVYVRRRQTLIGSMKAQGASGIALFLGNVESPAQYRDNCYKFRQDSNWLYYFGIDEPRYAAVLDLDSGEETVFADDVEIDDIIWMGPMPSVASVADGVGVAHSAPYGALGDAVASARNLGRKVHFLPASRYYNALKLGELLGVNPYETFSKGKAGCPAASLEMVRAVVQMRLVKEDIEIAELDHACTLGQQMHTVARQGIRIGVKEQEIVGAMEALTLAKGWGVSFATILTQHGEIFHCHSHEALIEPGKLLVIDAGLETNGHYASDFTRTYPTGGKFTARQRDIYQLVYECNEHAFSITRPGIAYLDVHLSVARRMLEGLKDLGLVCGDLDAMVEQGIAGLFMPHGLGHNMGLDVHDMEDLGENLVGYGPGQQRSAQLGLGSLRMARPLVPGNVVTDEPGIYFIPALIEQWKKEGTDKGFVNYGKLASYYDFGGIRLEDDVLITEGGARRLGSDRLPIAPDDVEAAMAADKG
ncbi:MAG: aminopeptidase P N-terminal domain-containing protein [Bacteroidales bacterium]|nr:aminopeptidase P N-terminal domain-containing protein [Bacteroidales bacterium]